MTDTDTVEGHIMTSTIIDSALAREHKCRDLALFFVDRSSAAPEAVSHLLRVQTRIDLLEELQREATAAAAAATAKTADLPRAKGSPALDVLQEALFAAQNELYRAEDAVGHRLGEPEPPPRSGKEVAKRIHEAQVVESAIKTIWHRALNAEHNAGVLTRAAGAPTEADRDAILTLLVEEEPVAPPHPSLPGAHGAPISKAIRRGQSPR